MGALLVFTGIAVFFGLTLFGWTMILKIQRDRKISDFKIQYLRVASSEEGAYQRYITTERQLQDGEMKMEKSRHLIIEIKRSLAARRLQLREMIEKLRVIKHKFELVGASGKLELDDEVEMTRLTNDFRSCLIASNEEKKRITTERLKIDEYLIDSEELRKEAEEHEKAWEDLRRELDKIEVDFRKLDQDEFVRFSRSFIKKRTQEGNLDPEREVINLLLMLNNKQSMLYVRKKEAAKDPTTDSVDLVRKYGDDIKKLELQLRVKAKRLGITAQRVEELKRLFVSSKNAPAGV